MSRPRVLVVEDRPRVLELIATILERACDVLKASDGEAALAIVGSVPLDVVLTDVRMPGASGFDVLRALRSRNAPTRVVMMTAYANIADAVAAIKLGAYDYVVKPLDADEISLVVARAIEHAADGADAEADPRAAIASAGTPGEGPLDVSVDFRRAVEEARDRASQRYLVELMRMFHGNVTNAATRAGMTRESLHRVLKRYGVRSEVYKSDGADQGSAVLAGAPGHER